MSRRTCFFLCCCLLVSLSIPCLAQNPVEQRWRRQKQEHLQEPRTEAQLGKWREEMAAIDELIRTDQSSKALKKGDRRRLGSDPRWRASSSTTRRRVLRRLASTAQLAQQTPDRVELLGGDKAWSWRVY